MQVKSAFAFCDASSQLEKSIVFVERQWSIPLTFFSRVGFRKNRSEKCRKNSYKIYVFIM